MEMIIEIWPFTVGQQRLIFNATGAAIIGLILLNVVSSIRQRLPFEKVLLGVFKGVDGLNEIEKKIRLLLFILALIGFFVLVLDTQINGVQLVNRGVR